MRNKPLVFKIMSLVFIVLAIAIPLQIMWIFEHSVYNMPEIYHKISYINWALIIMFGVNAYYATQASNKLYYTLSISILLVAYNNWLVGSMADYYTYFQTMLATVFYTVFTTIILTPKALYILNHQSQRWWRTAARLRMQIPVTVQLANGQELDLSSYDISKTGAFLTSDNSEKAPEIGDELKIRIKLADKLELECKASIVRIENARGEYPEGIGVRFTKMGLHAKMVLSHFLGKKELVPVNI